MEKVDLKAGACASVPDVSIIMPTYNSEAFVGETIESVIAQTYPSWELLVVDDCSTDGTCGLVEGYARSDARVRLFRQETNQGPAAARNRALRESRGRYVAYFDSDDLWVPEKLEHQLAFMRNGEIGMCFTSYETINEDGSHRNYVHVPESIGYKGFLKAPVTCTHTVMFDTEMVDRSLLVMPDLRKRQDGATWLRVLRNGVTAHGLDEILAKNRKRKGSVSANKLSAMKYTWHLYRHIERLSAPYAAYCQFWQLFHATLKRIGRM